MKLWLGTSGFALQEDLCPLEYVANFQLHVTVSYLKYFILRLATGTLNTHQGQTSSREEGEKKGSGQGRLRLVVTEVIPQPVPLLQEIGEHLNGG